MWTSLLSLPFFAGILLLQIGPVEARVLSRRVEGGEYLLVQIPPSPAQRSQVIDAQFVSYSIEFPNWPDYAGNFSNPNNFSIRLLENLNDIAGAYPLVRVGGEPADLAQYVSDQVEQVIIYPPGSQNPTNVSIGPTFWQSFQVLPEGIDYLYGLTFPSSTISLLGLNNTVAEAKALLAALWSRLYALEIGNEPEYWPTLGTQPQGYSVAEYIPEWLNTSATISQNVENPLDHFFYAGDFQSPLGINNISLFNVQTALELGMASTGKVKALSDHQYMGGGNCTLDTVLNRNNMMSVLYRHEFLANYTRSRGYRYVMGETNSCSSHGVNGVSNVFAAALWSIDYVLYLATINISRVLFHQGTIFHYSAWQPIDVNSTSLHQVMPLYYGNLFTATALAGGDKQVDILINETYLASYAIYTRRFNASELSGVVIVNKNAYNSSSTGNDTRPYISLQLPVELEGAQVMRLTAPSVSERTAITFAGQSVNNDGQIFGAEAMEYVQNGEVSVGDSEAVLISVGC